MQTLKLIISAEIKDFLEKYQYKPDNFFPVIALFCRVYPPIAEAKAKIRQY